MPDEKKIVTLTLSKTRGYCTNLSFVVIIKLIISSIHNETISIRGWERMNPATIHSHLHVKQFSQSKMSVSYLQSVCWIFFPKFINSHFTFYSHMNLVFKNIKAWNKVISLVAVFIFSEGFGKKMTFL